MNNKWYKIIILVFIMGAFSACEENLEVTPGSVLDGSSGLKTKQDLEGALNGVYSALSSANIFAARLPITADLYAGTLSHTGTFPSFAQIANRNILQDNTDLRAMWAQMYVGINRANTVIAAAPGISDPSFNANNAIGEARFLRAYNYLNLLLLFGGSNEGFNKGNGNGVPIFTTPTLTAEEAAPKARSSEAEVWALILEDLNFGIQNMNDNNGIGRVNKRVARALKARVHLYRNEWAEAEAEANEVITKGGYSLVPTASYADIWLKENTSESIWEYQFDAVTSGSNAFFYYPTSLGGRNEVNASAGLRDAHEANDIRRAVNYTTTPAARTQKYTRVSGEDNFTVIRLAEMYLIRAEAAAQLNKGDAARADLNIVRKRAGLADATAQSTEELIDAILKERRIEFAHEGLYWYDLRRLNRVSAIGITQPFRALWPIPERELQVSGGVITQNVGY
ncbi:MAG: RagB/SusD family nutrient uptake outer membrane protein [Saprospiraceae bacterium]